MDSADLLLVGEGWGRLLQDLREKVQDYSSQIVHGLPINEKDQAEQNFLRGKISLLEDLIGLEEELRIWKGRDKT